MIFEQLRLNVTRDTYVFTPLYEPLKEAGTASTDASLTVHRDTGVLEINASALPRTVLQEFTVYGIIGFVQLQAGEYMIVVTNQEYVGNLRGYHIYRATTFQILPLPRDLNTLSDAQIDDEQKFVHLLQDHLRQNSFYYSYGYDLTQSLQRQADMQREDLRLPMWQTADPRFFWNRALCEKLINAAASGLPAVSQFILPVIQGYTSTSSLVINGHRLTLGLVSRRSRERAGTRYFSRGLDEVGHASNFVETEQIVITEQHTMSFVQTRGSAPLIWGQLINTRYTPQLWIDAGDKVLEASRAHFNRQIQTYGPQILINLVNKKGYEYPVGRAYASIIDQLADPRLQYIHFDFHHECRKMKWDRVQLLIDKLESELVQQGFFQCDLSEYSNPVVRSRQSSVVRTNCMDCLDRTNVVQSALARWVLNRQLRHIGILKDTDKFENNDAAMTIFKNVWADNADILSIAYSGTGALKTDYTRTGKRTYMGAFNDLVNSLTRYVKNNYMDGSRQDAIDLFLGNYVVEPASFVSGQHHVSPFTDKRPLSVQLVPVGLVASLFAFLFALFFPDFIGIESSTLYIFLLSLCFASTISCWRYIQQNGEAFVDWPSLKPLNIPQAVQREHIRANGHTLRHAPERSNTAALDQVEQGYELPTLKKLT